MPTPDPNPLVLDSLCKQYRRASRADILAAWRNASLHWFDVSPEVLANEPPELHAARTLFTHSILEQEDREAAANYSMAHWLLVAPYARRK